MNNNIRQYQNMDLDEMLAVWGSATRLAHPFLTEAFLEQEKYNIPNVYLPITDTWVAVDNNRVVGFIALIGNEVGALFVDPDYHGQGRGRALLDKAHSLHDSLELDVFKENSIGRRFYERYGFEFLTESVHEETGNIVFRLINSITN